MLKQTVPALKHREEEYASFANFSDHNTVVQDYLRSGLELDRNTLIEACKFDIGVTNFFSSLSGAAEASEKDKSQSPRSKKRRSLVRAPTLKVKRDRTIQPQTSHRVIRGQPVEQNDNCVVIFADPWRHKLAERLIMWMNYRVSEDPRSAFQTKAVRRSKDGKSNETFVGINPDVLVSAQWLQQHPEQLREWILHDRVVNATLPVSMLQWPTEREVSDAQLRCRRILAEGAKPHFAVGTYMSYFDSKSLTQDAERQGGKHVKQALSKLCSANAKQNDSNDNEAVKLIFRNERNTLFRIQPQTLGQRLHFCFFAQLMCEQSRFQLLASDRKRFADENQRFENVRRAECLSSLSACHCCFIKLCPVLIVV